MQTEGDSDARIARTIAGLLFLQMSRVRQRPNEVPPATQDDFSVGYVFGFVDVMTQRVGIAGPDDAWRIFTILTKALFGHETGASFCARFVVRQHAPEVLRGAATGRSDSRSWLRDPAIPPVGWHQYCRGDRAAGQNEHLADKLGEPRMVGESEAILST